MTTDEKISAACRTAMQAELSAPAELRIREAIQDELSRVNDAPPKPIMTIREVAAYLRVNADVVAESLHEVPCFEFGGQILFRNEAVDAWIARREKKFAYDVMEFDAHHELLPRPRAVTPATTNA